MDVSMRSWILFVALLAAVLGTAAQDISALPACGQSCVNNILAKGSSLGCDSGATACLCSKPDFQFGISDCATQACGASLAPSVTNYASSLCATATQPAATQNPPASTSAPPPAPAATTSSSQAPATTSSSSSPASTSSDPAASTTSSEAAAAEPTTTQTGASSTGATQQPSATSSSSSKSGSSTGTNTAASAESTTPSAGLGPLSMTTKIGIGIGAAAAAASLIAVVVFLLIRRRRRGADKSMSYLKSLQISEPLPGAGRSYANDRFNAQYEKELGDLESRSRRYEDMNELERPRRVL